MHSIDVFPHQLFRLAAGPIDDFRQLDLTDSYAIANRIVALNEEIEKVKQQVCDGIYVEIQNNADAPQLQKRLLNFKRDVFNLRRLDDPRYQDLKVNIELSVTEQLTNLKRLCDELRILKEKGEKTFQLEMNRSEAELRRLAGNEALLKGLTLSSQTLLKNVMEFTETGQSDNTRKKTQTIESLIKYLSRIFAKTSPFSSFTNLAIGEITDNLSTLVLFDGDPSQTQSHVRLNNFLLAYLKDLLLSHRELRTFFDIRTNPTVRKTDDRYLFLTNHQNTEAFQRISVIPAAEVFLYVIQNEPGCRTYRHVVDAIISEEYIDAPRDDIEQFLDQLIAHGMIEFDLGVSGTDPDWDKGLIKKLTLIDHPLAKDCIDTLQFVSSQAVFFGTACDVRSRNECLNAAHEGFKSFCRRLYLSAELPKDGFEPKSKGEPVTETAKTDSEEKEEEKVFRHDLSLGFRFKPEQMFYEDVTSGSSIRFDDRTTKRCVQSLEKLLKGLVFTDGLYGERALMTEYYRLKYGLEARIDLMTFYEDFYRDYKKPEIERQAKEKKQAYEKRLKESESKKSENAREPEPENSEEPRSGMELKPECLEERKNLQKQWQEIVKTHHKELVKSDRTIYVTAEWVERITQKMELKTPKTGPSSFGAFLQWFEKDGRLHAVVNSVFPGFGKMTSRFLHMFESTADMTREWNNRLGNGTHCFAENTDGSFFNANLHPALLPFEVRIPGGHNNLPIERQIPLTDLTVEYDPQNDCLSLRQQTTGKQVSVFDLGFQGHGGRSPLFQLLDKFSPIQYLSPAFLAQGINQAFEEGNPATDEIRFLHRIVYDGWLVIQRRTWFIKKNVLPVKQPKESDWAYFSRIQQWRRGLQIPDEVFVYVHDRMNQEALIPDESKKLRRDDYKPQYVSFKNPFLVRLFSKCLDKTPKTIRITEMLPSSDELLSSSGKSYVTEAVCQWYDGPEVSHE